MKKPFLICIFICLYNCDLIFVENISNKTITITSPLENSHLLTGDIQFHWKELEGADEYNLQLVTPNITGITEVLIDTIITDNSYTDNLSMGFYTWRIKAINEEYHSEYFSTNFSIENDLSLNEIILLTPAEDAVLKIEEIIFSWEEIENVKEYQIQIENKVTNEILVDETITSTTFVKKLEIGEYRWRVKAKNELTETVFKTQSINVN